MRTLSKDEKLRWFKYHKLGGNSGTTRCPINKFVCHNGTDDSHNKHELAKLSKFLELVHAGHKVICEAVSNKTGLRHDLIDLSDMVIWEFETSHSRALRFVGMKDVEVVMVK